MDNKLKKLVDQLPNFSKACEDFSTKAESIREQQKLNSLMIEACWRVAAVADCVCHCIAESHAIAGAARHTSTDGASAHQTEELIFPASQDTCVRNGLYEEALGQQSIAPIEY